MDRESNKIIKNLTQDIRAVLKDWTTSPEEKNNLIYTILESYNK